MVPNPAIAIRSTSVAGERVEHLVGVGDAVEVGTEARALDQLDRDAGVLGDAERPARPVGQDHGDGQVVRRASSAESCRFPTPGLRSDPRSERSREAAGESGQTGPTGRILAIGVEPWWASRRCAPGGHAPRGRERVLDLKKLNTGEMIDRGQRHRAAHLQLLPLVQVTSVPSEASTAANGWQSPVTLCWIAVVLRDRAGGLRDRREAQRVPTSRALGSLKWAHMHPRGWRRWRSCSS